VHARPKGHSGPHWAAWPSGLNDRRRPGMVTVPGEAAAARLPPVNMATWCNSSSSSSMGRPQGTRQAIWWGRGLTEEVARCGGGGGGASQRRSWVATVT
jgi:hypothetical protein